MQCLQRWKKVICPGLVKGHWNESEDHLLVFLVSLGFLNWGKLAEHFPGRTSKQCRERWCHYLDPEVNKSEYSEAENRQLLSLYHTHGSRWCVMAKALPGRTENSIRAHVLALLGPNGNSILANSRKRRAGSRDAQGGCRNTISSPADAAPIAQALASQSHGAIPCVGDFAGDLDLIRQSLNYLQQQVLKDNLELSNSACFSAYSSSDTTRMAGSASLGSGTDGEADGEEDNHEDRSDGHGLHGVGGCGQHGDNALPAIEDLECEILAAAAFRHPQLLSEEDSSSSVSRSDASSALMAAICRDLIQRPDMFSSRENFTLPILKAGDLFLACSLPPPNIIPEGFLPILPHPVTDCDRELLQVDKYRLIPFPQTL